MRTTPVIDMLRVTETTARSLVRWIGKGDGHAATRFAAQAMRAALDTVAIDGEIVVCVGDLKDATALPLGDRVGAGGEMVDVAVDPLEGADLAAYTQPNSIVALAFAPEGALLHAPETYMWKVAVGPAAADAIHIDASPTENVRNVARALKKPVEELVVCVLDRDRHRDMIAEVRAAGAKVRLVNHGDVFPAVATSIEGTGIDVYMGAGGAAEGVLAAAAIRCIGGGFMGRFAFRSVQERDEAAQVLECDLDGVLDMDTLVGTDEAGFVATGVTDGEMLCGVHRTSRGLRTHSVMMDGQTGLVRFVQTISVAGAAPVG